MADDLGDFPVVVLENDYPEQIGKVGLFDYLMPVGTTGIVFVAAIEGRLYKWGPLFEEPAKKLADLRAASTLVQMGLIRGETFAFLRNALRLSQGDIATMYDVDLATVQAWEMNLIDIPISIWGDISCRIANEDDRGALTQYALTPDFRPRKIRVFPSIPPALQSGSSLPCTPPVPLVGPNCEPYVR